MNKIPLIIVVIALYLFAGFIVKTGSTEEALPVSINDSTSYYEDMILFQDSMDREFIKDSLK